MGDEIKPNRNLQVEGLRGLAILIVVVYHTFCRYQQIFMDSNIVWMQDFGTFGVGIFLLITCFFLVDFSSSKYNDGFRLLDYLKKKFLRLWPCYAVCISIISIVIHIAKLPNRMSSFVDWVLNIFFVNGFIGTPYVDGAHWYMSVLVSFLVIMAVARKLGVDTKPIFYILCVSLCMAVSLFGIPMSNALIGGAHIGYLCIAVAIRAFFQSNASQKDKRFYFRWGSVFLAGILAIYQFKGLVCVLELILILPILIGSLMGKLPVLENRVFQFLGTISYALYLIHQNMIYEIQYYLTYFKGEYNYLFGIVAIALIIPIAYLLYTLIEKKQPKKVNG